MCHFLKNKETEAQRMKCFRSYIEYLKKLSSNPRQEDSNAGVLSKRHAGTNITDLLGVQGRETF